MPTRDFTLPSKIVLDLLRESYVLRKLLIWKQWQTEWYLKISESTKVLCEFLKQAHAMSLSMCVFGYCGIYQAESCKTGYSSFCPGTGTHGSKTNLCRNDN